MKDEPSYYAIIPATVRYNKNLTANAKLLYGEITCLCNKKKYCWSTNKYFAKLYNVKIMTISGWIKSLVGEGFIVCTIKNNNMRRIYLKEGGIEKTIGGYRKNDRGGIEKTIGLYNTTRTNTINKKDVRKQVSDRSFGNETPKKSFYDKCTIKLIKLLQKKYKIRIPNKKKWINQFKLLNTIDGYKKKEIKNVLNWYCQHIGEFRVPNPLCAESFRLKFDPMKAAMRRLDEQIEKGEQKVTCRKIKRKKK